MISNVVKANSAKLFCIFVGIYLSSIIKASDLYGQEHLIIKKLWGHQHKVNDLEFSPDGNYLVSSSTRVYYSSVALIFWRLNGIKLDNYIPEAGISDLCFTYNNNILLGLNGDIHEKNRDLARLWLRNLDSKENISIYWDQANKDGGLSRVHSVASSKILNIAAASYTFRKSSLVGYVGKLRVFTTNGKHIKEIDIDTNVISLEFSPDGRLLAGISWSEERVTLWSTNDWSIRARVLAEVSYLSKSACSITIKNK